MSKEKDPMYKKLSWCIRREGSSFPFRNDYVYEFTSHQFLEEMDDLSHMSSYTYNEIKEIAINNLVEGFRISLNQVVFKDPAGRASLEDEIR